MAPHSSTLAWRIPWTGDPSGLQSMGSHRVGLDWASSLSRIGEGNGNPLQYSCMESPRDGGAWWIAVYGVAQSRTRLKRLSSSSSSKHKDLRMHVHTVAQNGYELNAWRGTRDKTEWFDVAFHWRPQTCLVASGYAPPLTPPSCRLLWSFRSSPGCPIF